MGEIKSVKVDNWGVFFLQKLQNFFNKTDYCDLTLQFNDNSQLKVHKLVLSACTDYFNVLEQTCEMIDDILIMPNELQADLVVPIVNFMYTGTLEFELKMYGKLLKTARDMNMTVLLKLLEAHRRTMEGGTKQVVRNTKTSARQTYLNAGIKPSASIPTIIDVASNTAQSKRRILSTRIEPYSKLQIKPISSTTYSDANTILTPKYSNTKITPLKGPSRFEYEGENILQETFESSFDTISYESKPLKEEHIEDDNQHHNIKQESTSAQFEQLRRTGYNNNKRPAQSILQSPPAKKPNIQDVKEYAEQQRMRKQIAEEYGEEFEDTLDDEFHNADDDEEYIPAPIQQQQHQIINKTIPTTSTTNLKQKTQLQNQINKKTTNTGVNVKQEEKPRIVVKDSTSSNVDHAKIISEVLRKYPHLIKNNKNIKLKIMPNASGNGGPQRVVIKKDPDTNNSPVPSTSKTTGTQETKLLKVPTTTQPKAQVQPSVTTIQQPITSTTVSQQPRRIDSKTMKALISLGAENTTGPWLCLRCGVNGRPISIPSYRGFRRHLINTHKETIDDRLCEHCGWRSTTHKELLFHMQMEHQIKCNINFPKCEHCGLVVLDLVALDDHIDEYHPENKEDNQQCIYCNKTFSSEILLYNHMKAQHKDRARDDGVIDFSDDEHTVGEFGDDEIDINSYEQESNQQPTSSKIQILSDINLPKCISLTKTTDLSAITITTSDSTTLTNDDYITTSAGLETDVGPKFVNAEGNVMELTPAQRDEIISQLEQSGDGVVMVLNHESFVNDEKLTDVDESSSSEKIQSITSQQFGDNNMLIVYDQQQPITTTTISDKNTEKIEENKQKRLSKEAEVEEEGDEDEDEMEWKSDVLQVQIKKTTTEKLDTDDNIKQKTNEKKEIKENAKIKKEDKDTSDLDMKLKLLTGDWTDDEDEECQDIIDENEKKTKDKAGDDKILDILEKNDSSDVTGEHVTTKMKEDTNKDNIKIGKLIEEEHEDTEENRNISGKTDGDTEEIQPIKDKEDVATDEKIEKEENFQSYPNDYEKDEEILFSTEISLPDPLSTIKKTEENKTKVETDDDKVATADEDVKESTRDTESADKEKDVEEYSEEIKKITKIKESEKSSVLEDFSVNEGQGGNDDDIKDVPTEPISDDTEKLGSDENLKRSDKVKPISESKDENDELSQTKTKDEIKNLISEWGEDDDDL